MENITQNNECCPKFNPEGWDEKQFTWKNRHFIQDRVFTFMHMPLNFGGAMKRMIGKVEASSAKMADGGLCLSDHTSKWNMNVYLAVDTEIPGATNTTLSGKFYSKVYEGPFSDTGKWCKDFEKHMKEKGMKIAKWYMWYTTCPKCAKKYGKNYTVIIAQVE